MTDIQLYKEIETLPKDLKKQVSDFVASLKEKIKSSSKEEKPKKRKAGIAKGYFIKMSDDFDEPLEDFKEYME
ncbi:MAG: DUF2281 domain-containing protein [Flavobacteriaceae bacterium]